MAKKIRFKISSALKNLIGQELITNEFIAVFELVKNSFDAHATKVTITFDNIYNDKDAQILIADDGKGMNYRDLIDKWLFVAYSAKREGTEDSGEYRDKINKRKYFAGAKGVGRFSCDRLGSKLNLVTVKDESAAKTESLQINWEDFELNSKKEFAEVNVSHSLLSKNPYKIKHGTVLRINNLRDKWDRNRILELRKSLGKLINPTQDNDNSDFSIEIIVPEERDNDRKTEENKKINGLIKNFLFEKLSLKTTQITSEISKDGKLITTTLIDRGRLIYKIKENSPFFESIHDIKIHLFQLNKNAKASFTIMMGMQPVQYGSVFLYKNGFRVYPFGEEGEDIFGVNRRKQQGYNRFLGTRDLIGRIEINGENNNLKETTSRDGGLIKNKSFQNLETFFYDFALRRLEKYVVDVIKWGDEKIIGLDKFPALTPEDVKPAIADIIASLSNSSYIIDFEYDKNFLDFISDSQEKSLPKLVKNFERIAEESGNKVLSREAGRMAKQVKNLLLAKKEAEKAQDVAQKMVKETEQKLEEEISEKLFVKNAISTDTKEILFLQHQINISTEGIKRGIDSLLVAINIKKPKKELLNLVERISFETNKISQISKFVTKANFNLKVAEITTDLVSFIKEYIENVYREYPTTKINHPYMHFKVLTNNLKFIYKFRPLEFIIIIDNLFSNSIKAGAKNILVSFSVSNNKEFEIKIKDDGKGIEKRNLPKIFNLGFTTTNGSGLGLYHVKQIIEKIGGHIDAEASSNGAELKIFFK